MLEWITGLLPSTKYCTPPDMELLAETILNFTKRCDQICKLEDVETEFIGKI
jgi:hypothetical protein